MTTDKPALSTCLNQFWARMLAPINAYLGTALVALAVAIVLLASVTTATFAAGILNMPAYIALRHLSSEIQISRTALNKELHMQNAILLRQTTNMTLEEIQELMQEDDVKEEKKGPVKRGNVKRGNVKRGWKIWRPKWPTRKNKRTESASSTVPESAQISQNKTTDERN